jgi:hypothetical protein
MKCRGFVILSARVAIASAVLLLGSLCMQAAEKWIEPFNGKDLAGWKLRGKPSQSKWVVGTASMDPKNPAVLSVTPGGHEMVNRVPHSVDIYTEQKFGDVLLEVELMVAKGSNSGIYLMGEYEIQVLDSYGRKTPGPGDMGGIYGAAAPKVNASKPAGQWQKYRIEFRAPRFDAQGKKTADARFVKVTLNGQVIHENVDMHGATGGALGPEAATGPLMFQGDHGPVAFRNIKIKPLDAEK